MDQLESILERFLALQGVALASVTGTDGLVIESAGRQEFHAEAVAAVAASALSAAQALVEEVTRGRLLLTMIEFECGVVILEPIDELAVLLVLTEDVSSMGRVRLVARRERHGLGQALQQLYPPSKPGVDQFRRCSEVLDCHSPSHIGRVAEMLADGEVVIFPVCGVVGFMCDGTNPEAIERVFRLKGRERTQALITAGSAATRERLVDLSRLSPTWTLDAIATIYDVPVFIIFPAANVPSNLIRPDPDQPEVPTVAIWWANFYPPMANLEHALQTLRPNAFLAGTSCNISGKPSTISSQDAFETFGRDRLVPVIVNDADFDEGRGLLRDSHTMVRIVGDCVVPYRAGSVHTDSLKALFNGQLSVPQGFTNLTSAAIVDVSAIRRNQHYLK